MPSVRAHTLSASDLVLRPSGTAAGRSVDGHRLIRLVRSGLLPASALTTDVPVDANDVRVVKDYGADLRVSVAFTQDEALPNDAVGQAPRPADRPLVWDDATHLRWPLWAAWLISQRQTGRPVTVLRALRAHALQAGAAWDWMVPLAVLETDTHAPDDLRPLWRGIDLVALFATPSELDTLLHDLSSEDRARLAARRPEPPEHMHPVLSVPALVHATSGQSFFRCAQSTALSTPAAVVRAVGLLTRHGWSIDQRDNSGATAFLTAPSLSVATALKDAGADPTVSTPDGRTILDRAPAWGSTAAQRNSVAATVASWLVGSVSGGGPSSSDVPYQEALGMVRNGSVTNVRPALARLMRHPPRSDAAPSLIGAAIDRIVSSRRADPRVTMGVLKAVLDRDTVGGWIDSTRPPDQCPGWTERTSAALLLLRHDDIPCLLTQWGAVPPPRSWDPLPAWCAQDNRSFHRLFESVLTGSSAALNKTSAPIARSLKRLWARRNPASPLDRAWLADLLTDDVHATAGRPPSLGVSWNAPDLFIERLRHAHRVLSHATALQQDPTADQEQRAQWERALIRTWRRLMMAGLMGALDVENARLVAQMQGRYVTIETGGVPPSMFAAQLNAAATAPDLRRRHPEEFDGTARLLATPVRRVRDDWETSDLISLTSAALESCLDIPTAPLHAALRCVIENDGKIAVHDATVRELMRAALVEMDRFILVHGLPVLDDESDPIAPAATTAPRRRM